MRKVARGPAPWMVTCFPLTKSGVSIGYKPALNISLPPSGSWSRAAWMVWNCREGQLTLVTVTGGRVDCAGDISATQNQAVVARNRVTRLWFFIISIRLFLIFRL